MEYAVCCKVVEEVLRSCTLVKVAILHFMQSFKNLTYVKVKKFAIKNIFKVTKVKVLVMLNGPFQDSLRSNALIHPSQLEKFELI